VVREFYLSEFGKEIVNLYLVNHSKLRYFNVQYVISAVFMNQP